MVLAVHVGETIQSAGSGNKTAARRHGYVTPFTERIGNTRLEIEYITALAVEDVDLVSHIAWFYSTGINVV